MSESSPPPASTSFRPTSCSTSQQSLTFDARGNVTAKNQNDQIRNNNKELMQAQTTYSYSRTFNPSAPTPDHQRRDRQLRLRRRRQLADHQGQQGQPGAGGMTWDATDRMRNVNDASASTDYTYDDSGQRAIERGPGGETATLNPWVTVRNTTDMYKYIWAGNDRIAEQRDNGGNEELQRYFLHKDLQGSTNIVTDYLGNTFQHQEYFPTGEVWVDENSTVFRTPFQYGGGYVDEVRALDNFGARWYDPNREMMYSPDPVLTDDPTAIVDHTVTACGLCLCRVEPVTNIDPSGQQFTPAQRKAFIKANFERARAIVASDPALRASLAPNLKTHLPKSFVRLGLDIKSADTAPEAVRDDRRHRQAVRRDQHLDRRGQVEPRSLQAVHCERGKGRDEPCRGATGKQQSGGRHRYGGRFGYR